MFHYVKHDVAGGLHKWVHDEVLAVKFKKGGQEHPHAQETTGLALQTLTSTTFTRTRCRALGILQTPPINSSSRELAGLNRRAGADADRQ
jgi:hypothetical protein